MDTLARIGYLDTDFDYASVVSEMLSKYTEDDLTELLCECETLLQTNDVYMTKLNERGLKRLFNLISGVQAKCKGRLLDNFQLIHRITLDVEKKILSRMGDLRKLVSSLNAKLENDNQYTRFCINSLLQKVIDHNRYIDKLNIKTTLMAWERYELTAYMSYSDTKKVLQVVSDIYTMTRGDYREVPNGLLQRALENLEVSEVQISLDTFAREICRDTTCLPLCVKNELDGSVGQIELSAYAAILYQVYDLVTDRNLQELCTAKGESMDALCLPLLMKMIAEKNVDAKSAGDICKVLLEDMQKLHEKNIQKELREQELIEADTKQRKMEEQNRQEQEQKEAENKKYSILRMTPEELHLFKDREEVIRLGCKKSYDFKDEEMLTFYTEKSEPYLVAAPFGFLGDHPQETKSLSSKKFVVLSDYYMYLWFHNTDKEKRANQRLAFLEYYGGKIYVYAYGVDGTGSDYEEGGQKSFGDASTIPNMHKYILAHKYFDNVSNKNSILVFQTFQSDLKGLAKLQNNYGVKIVDSQWEDMLKDNIDFRKNMISKF